jgi:hypothetical protein
VVETDHHGISLFARPGASGTLESFTFGLSGQPAGFLTHYLSSDIREYRPRRRSPLFTCVALVWRCSAGHRSIGGGGQRFRLMRPLVQRREEPEPIPRGHDQGRTTAQERLRRRERLHPP